MQQVRNKQDFFFYHECYKEITQSDVIELDEGMVQRNRKHDGADQWREGRSAMRMWAHGLPGKNGDCLR